jgi:hypothetical protein
VSLETAQANIINTTRTDAADARNPSGRIFGFKPWMKGVPDKNNSPPGANYNRGIPSLRFHSIQNFEGNVSLPPLLPPTPRVVL